VNRDLRRGAFRPGDALELGLVRVEVLEVVAGDARHVRFDFRSESMPPLCAWRGRELHPFISPRAGESVELGPLSLL
jgi:hypothetical protein